MIFQSEIRQSDIIALLDKVKKHNYETYLFKVDIGTLRGLREQSIAFDFPVTAIVGPNGGGKTTILGAAACAYESVKPRRFFAKSGKFDESMADWKIEYHLVDKSRSKRELIRTTATFKRSKWDRDALSREVVTFGVARTVPANERAELRRYASNTFSVDAKRITQLSKDVASAVARILGKDVSKYSHASVDKRGRVSLLTGSTDDGVKYSEFHFGAGESSIIRMLMKIESLSDSSLILIEEIENGLHPMATVAMVEYLISVSKRKKCQAIFTTHSNDALLPLPNEAIWAAVNTTVIQGKLDIHSLRAITGQVSARLIVFVEDDFAKAWVESAIRATRVPVDLVEVHAMHGDGMAVKVNQYHNIDPSARGTPSICILDGDSRQQEDPHNRIFRLPGSSPELYIYDRVLDIIDAQKGILAVALHRRYEDQNEVARVVKEVRLKNVDPHTLFSQVGKQLGLIPEETVRGAFLSVWAQTDSDQVQDITGWIQPLLPTTSQSDKKPARPRPPQKTDEPSTGQQRLEFEKR